MVFGDGDRGISNESGYYNLRIECNGGRESIVLDCVQYHGQGNLEVSEKG